MSDCKSAGELAIVGASRRPATLIVCPTSLLSQWHEQLVLHVVPHQLSVYVHHGQHRTKDASVLAAHDVTLTTYGVLASEFGASKAQQQQHEEVGVGDSDVAGSSAVAGAGLKASGGARDGACSSGRLAAPFAMRWRRVVLDEAHYIKCRTTQAAQAVFALHAECRWAVTGERPASAHLGPSISSFEISISTFEIEPAPDPDCPTSAPTSAPTRLSSPPLTPHPSPLTPHPSPALPQARPSKTISMSSSPCSIFCDSRP